MIKCIEKFIEPVHYEMTINDTTKEKKPVTSNNCFVDLPEVLHVSLKRMNRENNSKNNKKISFPSRLNMNHLVYNGAGRKSNRNNKYYPHYDRKGPYIYDLKFVIVHKENVRNKNMGHYICLSNDSNSWWNICDDDDCEWTNCRQYQKYFGGRRDLPSAYVLGYVKQCLLTPYLFKLSVPNANVEESINPINDIQINTNNMTNSNNRKRSSDDMITDGDKSRPRKRRKRTHARRS